jgi:hypothetical protein
MATAKEENAVPDFLRMDQPISSDPANVRKTGNWYGWPTKDIKLVTLTDDAGRTVRIRTPVMDLEGLITPTNLHYTVQHFAVPPIVETDTWELKIVGEVKAPLTLNFDQLRRFPGRSVRTVMECSGSDATSTSRSVRYWRLGSELAASRCFRLAGNCTTVLLSIVGAVPRTAGCAADFLM